MQDNLEFLQWTKRHWNVKWPGGPYDAVGRRKGAGRVAATAAPAPIASARTSGAGAARRGTTPTTARPRRTGAAGGTTASAAALQEINQMKETVAGLERERDFYFSKLRDIELLLQQAVDDDPGLDKEENSLIKQVQAILYSTEVGCWLFELLDAALTIYRRDSRYRQMMVVLMSKKHSECGFRSPLLNLLQLR